MPLSEQRCFRTNGSHSGYNACKRRRNLAYRTEKAYLHWIRRDILFHKKQHPKDLFEPDVVAFLTWLADARRCSSATQNQALCALVFLYRFVLERELGRMASIQFAKRRVRTPVALSADEVAQIIRRLKTPHRLIVSLLYSSGLRVTEALSLRLQDIDYSEQRLHVRLGKGRKGRIVTLSSRLLSPLQQ